MSALGPRARVVLVLVVALLLHTSVLPGTGPGRFHPDLMLLVAIAAGLAGGAERGAVIGFVAGLLADLFVQAPMGLSALVLSLVGFSVGTLQAGILRVAWWITPATAFVASAAGVALYAVAGAMVGQSVSLDLRLGAVVTAVAAVNAVLSPFALRALEWSLRTTVPDRSFAR